MFLERFCAVDGGKGSVVHRGLGLGVCHNDLFRVRGLKVRFEAVELGGGSWELGQAVEPWKELEGQLLRGFCGAVPHLLSSMHAWHVVSIGNRKYFQHWALR